MADVATGQPAAHVGNVDPATGRLLRREDGKILKPEGWRPPKLSRLLEEHNGR